MTPLLAAENLLKTFAVRPTPFSRAVPFRAVDGVSLQVGRGETLAVVGESGCGKSTVGRLLLRLQAPDAGTVRLDGEDVLALRGAGLRRFRRRVQVVFQDPFASLDPRERVGSVLTRPMRLHGIATGQDAVRRAAALLERVGLPPAALSRLPHEFSGGQRQRIAIARALSVGPDLLVCDEPVSALDVSVQAQVVNLLADLQRETGLALLFISHDLAVVRHLAHRVAVMYAGRLVETAAAAALFAAPAHPYTRALLAAVPRTDIGARRPAPLPGEPPDPMHAVPGCCFATRCPFRAEPCVAGGQPPLAPVAPGHASACLFAQSLPPVDAAGATTADSPALRRITAYRRARDAAA